MSEDLVGIFDIERTTVSRQTRSFLRQGEKQGTVENVAVDLPKSFILTANKRKGVKLYISQISSATLKKRGLSRF